MKFGSTLTQRSVPQYAPYNVNYNELKAIIKDRTVANAPADPIAIGSSNAQTNKWNKLEDDLYPLLWHEFDRASSFVKVKCGEIDRRLTFLERQFHRLQQPGTTSNTKRPLGQSRRFQKLVTDAHEVGDEVQALIRFCGVQRTAFRKILKKYRKWTGSTTLEQRCRNGFLEQSDALQPDMSGQLGRLAKLSSYITTLTQPAATTSSWSRAKSKGITLPSSVPAKIFKDVLDQSDSPLDLDVALDFTPLGKSAGRAVYWVHIDHLEETTILLQRYMRQTFSPAPFNQTLFDNLGRFVQEMNATPIAQLEDGEGITPAKVAMTTRWNDDDAIVSLSDISGGARSLPKVFHIRPKDVPKILKRDVLPASCEEVQQYLTLHRDVKALASLSSVRSTYCGNNNNADVGQWATLDQDIIAGAPSVIDSKSSGLDIPEFPHAVLEIRWEFSPLPEIVRSLDHGQLVERIRGFSLEEYAIFAICKPENATVPIWQAMLQKDIRKLSLSSTGRGKKASTPRPSTNASSTEGHSDSIFTPDQTRDSESTPYTPATSMNDLAETTEVIIAKPRKFPVKYRKHKQPSQPDREAPRYWNEFDDGSEAEEDTYAIYVNPDEDVRFPGAETISKALSAMQESVSHSRARLFSWLRLTDIKPRKRPSERDPLLPRSTDRDLDDDNDDSSSSSDEAIQPEMNRKATSKPSNQDLKRSLSLSSSLRTRRRVTQLQKTREKMLTRSYVGLIALGFFLLGIARILRAYGRRKAVVEVAGGIIACAVLAEACAVVAVTMLMLRKQKTVSVWHKMIVGGCVAGVVIWGVAVLVSVAMSPKR